MRPMLLLDTCAAIFLLGGLSMCEAAVAAIDAAALHGDPIHVSPITALEIGTLQRKGRLRSSVAPHVWWRTLSSMPGFAVAPLSPDLLLASSFLPGDMQGDPAGRILAATAREYGHTVITRDRALLAYAETGYMLAIAC